MIGEKQGSNQTGLEIAVIGMAGRFPGATSIHEFWNNLKNGIESISFFSDRELEQANVNPGLLKNPDYVKANGILEGMEYFDPVFFDYTPGEVEIMDPQIRIFHECVWSALEDAGYFSETYDGLIGVYAGASANSNWEALGQSMEETRVMGYWAASQLIDKDYISARVSYKLNLKGPAVNVQTACSTSLVAIHMAYKAILTGECDIALAGGATVTALSRSGYIYQEGMILSPDGHCRAFDAKANGIVSGNGVGIVALKRLQEAVEDGDHIYAVVKATSINNDGYRKIGFTAPSIEGQAEAIVNAQEMAEVEPESITYIETHGTGTELGDPVEIEALTLAFNTDKKDFCAIGSVKSNMGHLDSAAGVAGFIKTVLALKYKLIPPSLHFENQNTKIDFKNTPFYVNTALTQWKNSKYPLRAGVSSFGLGGTNAHVILEEFSEETGGLAPLPDARPSREYQLILLSAKTQATLDKMTENLAGYFKKNPHINIADAAYTLQVGRRTCEYRRALVCSSINEAIQAFENPGSDKVQTFFAADEKKYVVFMFSGQGSQYIKMGLDIYREQPSFRADVDRCLDILKSIFGYDVRYILFPGKEKAEKKETKSREEIDEVIYSGPIKFILDYSLARLLMKWGIQPHAMIGHSFGEYVAACLSGVFSLEDALQVVVWRGQLMKKTPKGVMMSVPMSEKELKPLLNEDLSLAAVNTSSLCIVSGTFTAADKLENQLKEQGEECVRLNFPHPSHSRMMEPILEEFQEKISRLKQNKPRIPYISDVTGQWITDQQATDPAYWTTHMRQTVRFEDGITGLLKKTNAVFVQVGPGRGLTLFVEQHQDKTPGNLVIHLLRHPKEDIPDTCFLLDKIGRLWMSGVNIDWQEFYSNEKRYRMPLPSYPFHERRCWKHIDNFFKNKGKPVNRGKLERHEDITEWFYVPSWERSMLPPQHTDEAPNQSSWLVFTDACGLGHNLRKRLEQEGRDVIAVRAGSEFGKVNDREFIVNPAESRDYDSLFGHLQELKKIPHKILHLWAVTPTEHPGMALEPSVVDKAQCMGILSLLHLVKTIGNQDIINDLQIFAVSNNMQDVTGEEELCPEKATLQSPIIVIPQEFPNITCRSIDIMLPGPGSSLEQEDSLTDQLIVEFHTKSSNPMIAYRGNYRWEKTYKQVRLEENPKTAPTLRKKGVYLITGGLGKIGLLLAKYFAETVKAKLILTGRSALPSRKEWNQWLSTHDEDDTVSHKIRKVLELEELGAEILVLKADVVSFKQMQEVMNTIDETFGRLNGVVHTAGVIDARTVQVIKSMDINEFNRQFQPKVYGLLILERILRDRELDFCSLTSSISSVLGGLGHVVYSAANIFMDAYVHKHNRLSKVRWTSVNWDVWEYRERKVLTATIGAELAKLSMMPEQAIMAFLRILAWPEASQVLTSTGNLQTRLQQWVQRESPEEEDDSIPEDSSLLSQRPALSVQYVSPSNELEQGLAEIWKSFFGIQLVGIDDDFFELGGDSLKAMIVASIIHKKLNVKVSVTNIFTTPTIKELAEYINDNVQKSKYSSIEHTEEKEYYPLSPAQKRLYILQLMEKNSTSYNEQIVTQLEGELDKERLEDSFGKLIDRHDMLRTSFEMINNEPLQRIHHEVEFEIEYYDLNTLHHSTAAISNPHPAAGLIENFIRPFDLSYMPILRVWVIKSEDSRHIVIVDTHHIITDGISRQIFTKELMAIYGGEALPLLPTRYKDFSQWQNNWKAKDEMKRQGEYWLKQFETEPPVINLPGDYPRPAVQSFNGNSFSFMLEKEKTKALKALADREGVTLFMLLLSIYNIFLSKLSGQEDIVVGTPIAGRRHPDLKGIIGMFVNTLALRNYPRGGKTFKDFLKEVKKSNLEAFENQDYQFEDLVEEVVVTRDVSRNPIFDVMFVMLNLYIPSGEIPEVKIPELRLKPYEYRRSTSKFDMTFFVVEAGEELALAVEYVTEIFKEKTIRRFIGYFKQIISAVIENSLEKISGIEIIPTEEKHRVLYDFNNTDAVYPKDKTIHELFEEQVEKSPDRIAVVGMAAGTRFILSFTYKELNENTNRLALRLRSIGIQPNHPVGIMVERSIEMILGIFAILKAGGAYLPIDPDYPGDRIKFMLADSGAKVLVTTSTLAKEVKKLKSLEVKKNFEVILIDSFKFFSYSSSHLLIFSTSHSSNLAYIIYTSGSTGKPKGVMVEHTSVINILTSLQKEYPLMESDTYLLKTSYIFDVSVTELFGWYLEGGRMAILEKGGEKNPVKILDTIESQGVTHINFVPSMFNVFLESLNPQNIGRLSPLKYIFLAGEAIMPESVEKIRHLDTTIMLENIYGPTEATIYASRYSLSHWEGTFSMRIPIGKPMSNIRIYILDKYDCLQPVGIPGELCISGTGLARGYLNRPELNAEKFSRSAAPTKVEQAHHLTLNTQHSTLYKTDDLARWLPDGNIEFLGRMDHQVKVRGFRVELGEIETRLLKHKEIKEVVVTVGEVTRESYLCAYFVSDTTLTVSHLREFLSRELPGYMIPSYFVQMEKVPLTPNGKIDRKALPQPEDSRPKLDVTYVAPQTDNEKIIAGLLGEVMQLDEVGIYDNFFELGLNSLGIIRLSSKLKEVLKMDIPVVAMFRYTTIHSFAHFLSREQGGRKNTNNDREQFEAEALNQSKNMMKQTIQRLGMNQE